MEREPIEFESIEQLRQFLDSEGRFGRDYRVVSRDGKWLAKAASAVSETLQEIQQQQEHTRFLARGGAVGSSQGS